LFLREDIFGRDAKSVFPTESVAAEQRELESTREALGARAFISEKEVRDLRCAHSFSRRR
jgi:hypothetical protein